MKLTVLKRQDLLDMVDGAAIFSAGGGGDPEVGYNIVEKLVSEGYHVELKASSEVPDDVRIVNFACVGATTDVAYDAEAAVKTLKTLEEYAGFYVHGVVPVELGGFNTLAAVDVAARREVPVVDADGAGRSVPEVHLKVYSIDGIPLTPMVVADSSGRNMVIAKETLDLKAAERIARVLAAEWSHSAYTARRILTGAQVKTSPIQRSLSRAIIVGRLLRESADPVGAVLKEAGGLKLFEGITDYVRRRTEAGFTFINVKLRGTGRYAGSVFEFKAKNEVLVAYRDGDLVAIAPDIVTPVNPESGKCVTAEKIEEGSELSVLGLPAPQKWRTVKGLELWKDALERAEVTEEYVPLEQLAQT